MFTLVVGGFSWAISYRSAESHLHAFLLTSSVCLIVLICSMLIGFFLGFLFGIPRSVQRAATVSMQSGAGVALLPDSQQGGASHKRSAQSYITNTNLEDISDWLTKIIIGISLVQFQNVLNYIRDSAVYSASFVAAKSPPDIYDGTTPMPFFMGLIVTGVLGGFLFSYLETRVRLTLIFISAENTFGAEEQGALLESGRRSITESDDAREQRAQPQLSPATEADRKLAAISRSEITDPKELVGWASAQARLGNFAVAEAALRDALQGDPGNVEIYMRIADVRRLQRNYAGAVAIIQEGVGKAGSAQAKAQLLHRAILTALYLPRPDGFQQAIELSDTLLNEVKIAEPSVYLWRAAAFGQNYSWLKRQKSPQVELDEVREKALESVRRLVQMLPSPLAAERVLLRALFDPSPAELKAGEDDLRVFAEDKEFSDLIMGQ
ncbi:tetratricopeptide repeat protein [Bosea sp. BH3]|uniref:tetratricopeptide repeat protein n=1 Tax=Bosea sp. BH3 TaxID=2871701 RepID=UPI0021CB7548|nr:hypothetical protein [Bosea sp. BH3]MCU4177923.1 hypothetical protein [Bosea sp. BH3]